MKCPDPVELSRALVAGMDVALQAHVDGCPRCAAEVEANMDISDVARELPVFEPSVDHARQVRAMLLAAARLPAPAARARIVWGVGAAALLAAAAVIALVIGMRTSESFYRGSIHAHEGAQYVRVGAAPDEIVRLIQGTVTVEVEKLLPGERFRVVTDDGEVEVRGTAFDVTADRDHLLAVRVLHGRVEVRPEGTEAIMLGAGERWDTKLARHDKPTLAEPAALAAHAAAQPTFADPARPTGLRGGPARSTPGRTTTRTAPASTARSPASAPAQELARTAEPPAARTVAKRPIELLFEEGWAALAAGDARGAATTFERAARSAPRDPLAEDAWFWRASALARSRSTAASGALEAFLTSYPRSPRVGEASAMLGWLIVDSDLERAETLFRAAAKDRVAAVRASGAKGLSAIGQRRGIQP